MSNAGRASGSLTSPAHDVIVIGGGQAGLAMGYELSRRGVPCLILHAYERIGDAWRTRWDSLRLFTPARYDSLPGMPFPAPGFSFPTKNVMGDYLESYARRFQLPVQTGVPVDRLARKGADFETSGLPVRVVRLLLPALKSLLNLQPTAPDSAR